MCGITGVFSLNERGNSSLDKVREATKALAHRGPDADGFYEHRQVALGHRRLSIIDVSDAANQPMTDESGRYVLVYNGELYNHKELRRFLESLGVSFRTSSDTEVLLKGLIHEGSKFLNTLNGFFSLALYDKEENSLLLARDRMGIKPLVVYQDEDRIVFASEIKALMAYDIPRELDYSSLQHYLQLNYVPSPHSMLKGVRKVKPGHFIKVHPQGNLWEKEFYRIPYPHPNTLNTELRSYQHQLGKMREVMEESVRRRLIADVPVGCFLSGGIDSSVITTLAAKHHPGIKTFSIGYKDNPFFDETHYAELVANKAGTDHTTFKLGNEELYDELSHVLEHMDEPFADSSALPVSILSRKVREHVKVALSGDGADELFSGYNKHMAEWQIRNAGFKEKAVGMLKPLWGKLPQSRHSKWGNLFRQLDRFAEGMNLSDAERYWRWCGYASENSVLELLSDKSKGLLSEKESGKRKKKILRNFTEGGDMNEVLLTDMQLVLVSDMLTKVDSMSMAHSLEVRVPFLSHNVVNFAFGLPEESKINGEMKKRIVQDAFRRILPEELYQRPKKGFEVPLLQWLQTDLRPMIENDLLADDFIHEQGIFSREQVRQLKNELFSKNPGDSHARIWGLLVFQHWMKKYSVIS